MDERFVKEEGLEVFTGTELIIKGALESGVGLITGYPGSPVSDVFDAASSQRDLLKKHGILAAMANNEALSAARLNGARMAGVKAMAVMKSVGMHVAADGLALGNLSEPNNEGGGIVVVGDDPWIDSTQINNDSRFLSQHLHMPVLEPSTFQEMKDWVGVAFSLSSSANLYITFLVTTNQADGGGTVWLHPNRYPAVSTIAPLSIESEKIDLDRTVLLPPRTWHREVSLPRRIEKLWELTRERNLNPVLNRQTGRSPLGLVSSGLSYCYLEHALMELGLSGKIPVLKAGLTYPLDPEPVLTLAGEVDAIVVVEEKRGFLEQQITGILQDARQSGSLKEIPEIWGKKLPKDRPGFPEARGLNTSLIIQILVPFLKESLAGRKDIDFQRLEKEAAVVEATSGPGIELPARTPTFCPGCPHRDSSSVFLQIKKDFSNPVYMKKEHGRDPVDLIFHGETGCFTMLMFEPNRPLMHNYSGMGIGGGTGAGLDPFVTNKQVVFLGDSTFFHSGMIAISDSIKSGQDITYVILDNKTTAMTGHQPTPGTEFDLMGDNTFAQNIESIVQGMAQKSSPGSAIPVSRVNPADRDKYRTLLEETVLKDGVKVIIADKECGITFHRRKKKERKAILRREGFLPLETHVNITPEVCEFCLECTKTTGCPGLTIEQSIHGPKIATDPSLCVSDGACVKLKNCPSFEELIIERKSPPRHAPVLPDLSHLPPPPAASFDRFWYGYTAGVGGMGLGLVSAILVQAGQRQGYRVLFSDKKGLAIRNGGVFGHIIFSKEGGVLAPLVPYGKADLILGIDLLETARGLDPRSNLRIAHPERSRAVVNTAAYQTILMLLGRDTMQAADYEAVIRRMVRLDAFAGFNFSAISEHYFGSALYSNMLLLGTAIQKGWLPLDAANVEWAIAQSVPKDDRALNIDAFRAGRLLAVSPGKFNLPQRIYTYRTLLAEKIGYLKQLYGSSTAAAYRALVEEAILHLPMDDSAHLHLAQRVYDLICCENIAYARRYADLVLKTAQKDRASWGYRATLAVLHQSFRLMAIKDEIYVAHLLTSPEKKLRDLERFGIDEANGDRVRRLHVNRPEITVFGRSFRWNMTTQNWQLNIVKRLKFLRRLLPGWHADEKAFRDWYLDLAARFDADDEQSYALWLKILRCPENVRGYREARVPLVQEARKQAAACLEELNSRAYHKHQKTNRERRR
jgi:indolepyruvate ferredoxin oxidoreductase